MTLSRRAPVRRTGGRLPVVVYSQGAHDHRSDATIAVQEPAGHGYLVVTVDHAYDSFMEFLLDGPSRAFPEVRYLP
ncbi:hypothetical protein [Actinoplanes sp. NBRC 103695]|uniref:hypothetical protein n=1 Tax=Actinoplanes sp. NBRC 103695 TaxID=3032202 RepID=UPI0024A320E8|nr:hypothetical protein [Actinoplanes sp. NBRC 103695]GLY94463.1 hypothetical protein Acsp02_17190 [Actinoplanes sp. NBRC 103695]